MYQRIGKGQKWWQQRHFYSGFLFPHQTHHVSGGLSDLQDLGTALKYLPRSFFILFLVYSNHSVFPFHSLPFCFWIWFLFVADQLLTQLSEYMKATYGVNVHNVNAAALCLSAYLLLSLFLLLIFFWCVFHSPFPLGFIKAISLLQYLCEKICDWAYCRRAEIDVRCLSNILTHSCLLRLSFLICLCSWRRSAALQAH